MRTCIHKSQDHQGVVKFSSKLVALAWIVARGNQPILGLRHGANGKVIHKHGVNGVGQSS